MHTYHRINGTVPHPASEAIVVILFLDHFVRYVLDVDTCKLTQLGHPIKK